MKKSGKVTKSNELIKAGYKLTLIETQIILYGLSLVNPLSEDFPEFLEINIQKFSKMFNKNFNSVYDDVKDAVTGRLWNRDFSYCEGDDMIVKIRWLIEVRTRDKSGYIQIRFSDEIRPYLHQLKNRFTTYILEHITSFKSIYSIRIYELACMRLGIANEYRPSDKMFDEVKFELSLLEIRESLCLHNLYLRFYDLKVNVLEKAKAEINKFSDINLTYSLVKVARSVKKIIFTISLKPQKKFDNKSDNKLSSFLQKKILTPAMIEKAKSIIKRSGTRWDIYAIIEQFESYKGQKGEPENIEAAFLGFVKHKVKSSP